MLGHKWCVFFLLFLILIPWIKQRLLTTSWVYNDMHMSVHRPNLMRWWSEGSVLVYSAGSRYTRADMRNDFLGDNAIAICHGMPPMVLTIIRFYPLLYDSRNWNSMAHGVIILERGGTTQYWNFLRCLTIRSLVPHVGPVLKCLLVNLRKMGVWSWEFQNENKMFSLLPRDRSQEVSLEKYVQNKVKNSLRWISGDAKSGMITVIMDDKNVWFVLGPTFWTWGASFSFSTSKKSGGPNTRFAQIN
jgi:hypothetical protein